MSCPNCNCPHCAQSRTEAGKKHEQRVQESRARIRAIEGAREREREKESKRGVTIFGYTLNTSV